MVRRRSTVRFRNGAPGRMPLFEKIWTRLGGPVGTNGCPHEALAARQRQSRQAMPAAPWDARGSPADPGHDGEGAGDGCAGIMPTPGGPGGGSRAIVRCRARYRIPPGPGRGHQPGHGARTSGGCGTAPGPGSKASGRRPRAAADGRRHSRPGLRARRQATMTLMRPPRTRGGGRQPVLPAGQQPVRGALATGHGAAPRAGPVSGKDFPPARQHHGHRPCTCPDRSVAGAQDCPRSVG
jgi:hypothetical protein